MTALGIFDYGTHEVRTVTIEWAAVSPYFDRGAR